MIVIGAGVIGLATAWRLQKAGLRVQLIERGEPGREASYAAAGMLAVCDPHNDAVTQPLAEISGALYPEFVRELQDEARMEVDFRDEGVIAFLEPDSHSAIHPRAQSLSESELVKLAPCVVPREHAYFVPEQWVDPRRLCAALVHAIRHREGDIATGSPVIGLADGPNAHLVKTEQTTYGAAMVVNCAGAWAGQLDAIGLPTRPVKGQMLSVVPLADPQAHPQVLRHVVRAPEVYLVPRSDRRIIIGSTLEEAGFDKNVDPAVIQRLHQAAGAVVPAVQDMRIHEVWAGLRPGTPDGRPIIGKLRSPGHFIAAGHYRDGILLAPATAEIIAALVLAQEPPLDLRPFAPNRFQR